MSSESFPGEFEPGCSIPSVLIRLAGPDHSKATISPSRAFATRLLSLSRPGIFRFSQCSKEGADCRTVAQNEYRVSPVCLEGPARSVQKRNMAAPLKRSKVCGNRYLLDKAKIHPLQPVRLPHPEDSPTSVSKGHWGA